MNAWTKLFQCLLTSTVWQESLPVKVVWITLLAAKDKGGYVEGSVPGLAKLAGVTVEECQEALEIFKAPDKWSRSKEHGGRRIREIEGGWEVLNHFKYRDEMSDYRREKNAEYQRRHRAKVGRNVPTAAERQYEKEIEGRG